MKHAALFFLPLIALAPSVVYAEEKVDLSIVHRIRMEAFESSRVMDHAFWLTDVYGPRLTNSPGFNKAAEWAVKRLTEYGLTNAKLEAWGPYGRTWSFSRFSAHLLEPQYTPLIGAPLAWSNPTNGPLTGEPILARIETEDDMAKHSGKLRGQIVLIDALRPLMMITTAPGRRFTEAELAAAAAAPEPGTPQQEYPGQRPLLGRFRNREELTKWRNKVRDYLIDEGVLLAVMNARGEGGTVFAQSASTREAKDRVAVPTVALTPEHYNRIARLLEKKIPVRVEFEIQSAVIDAPADSFNVIAEIPGTRKRDEVVMLGAHLDSWHSGTGATDNAAGVAVVMEAARILKTLNLPMDRTVRVALWGGEEQGLLGSKGYVKQHFADPEVMQPLPEHGRISGYFNIDNGTGKIRGVYLQSNDMMRPIFEAWLAPFRDLGVTTVSIRNTGSTDHASFDRVGIPGFQFIQDQIEYSTRTHHSNMDVYDRLQRGDLMQASAVLASVLYHAAMRPEMLPRKPLPKPEPKKTPEAKPEAPVSSGGGTAASAR
ncbi:MAG TPA: M20/M25/M40 family metallo-hydrolase [Bryobacteraceae bacterium]|nr:M20/M25/M40 family metallo-hydrolase [Bryobacteraceae bacterium]